MHWHLPHNRPARFFVLIAAILIIVGLAVLIIRNRKPSLVLTSPAFKNNGQLASTYTCDNKGINPPFQIENHAKGTKSYVLIAEDADFHHFVHWLVWDIAPTATTINEGEAPLGGTPGRTNFGFYGYRGACPPAGETHRYTFTLFALDKLLKLPQEADRSVVEREMKGHTISLTSITATYQRIKK